MKILLAGGSGQIGTLLARAWHARGHEVVVLGRGDGAAGLPWSHVRWDARQAGSWCDEFDGSDVVLNLAGRSVDCRYTAANRRAILESRVDSTRAVGAALAACRRPPGLWLQASTATIYDHRFDAPNDEAGGLIGGSAPGASDSWRFSVEVAKAWEGACLERDLPHTRRVLLRSAMAMSPDRGGIFDVLLGLVRRGLGGTCGSGRQFVSWIHDADLIAALDWLIAHAELDGPVILAAPEPLPNAEFMRALREAWGTRIGLPATAWMLEIGALFLRTETELILKSRRVVPGRLLASGFEFTWPTWPEAARDLVQRWRTRSADGAAPPPPPGH